MNALHRDLCLDQLHTAARRRHRRRFICSTAIVAIPLLLCAKLSLFPASAPGDAAPTLTQVSAPPIVTSSLPAPTPLASDEELLAILADQGPVLVSHPDGSQTLILTRPLISSTQEAEL